MHFFQDAFTLRTLSSISGLQLKKTVKFSQQNQLLPVGYSPTNQADDM